MHRVIGVSGGKMKKSKTNFLKALRGSEDQRISWIPGDHKSPLDSPYEALFTHPAGVSAAS